MSGARPGRLRFHLLAAVTPALAACGKAPPREDPRAEMMRNAAPN